MSKTLHSLTYTVSSYQFYFVYRGLHPSQGGKYVGFGSGPVQSEKNADSGNITILSQISNQMSPEVCGNAKVLCKTFLWLLITGICR